MKTGNSRFESVNSVLHYLQDALPTEVVTSSSNLSTKDVTNVNNASKSTKRRKKEKEQANIMFATEINSKEIVQVLPSGHVKYGPIMVNPRKQPSKTLFTGRRSKYEELSAEEEAKRLSRRQRNRLAAEKCRGKRENILTQLEDQFIEQGNKYKELEQEILLLKNKKKHFERMLETHLLHCQLQQTSSMTYSNPIYQPSIVYQPMSAVLPSSQSWSTMENVEQESNSFLQQTFSHVLLNSAYDEDQANQIINIEQQSQQQTLNMTTSSLDRLINSEEPSISLIDSNNNHTYSGLVNSAYESSSCIQQHASPNEDGSSLSVSENSSAHLVQQRCPSVAFTQSYFSEMK